MSFLAPDAGWSAPKMSELPDWDGVKRIAVDVETKDPDLKAMGPGIRRDGSHVVGVSFAIEGGPAHYLPFRHGGGGNLPEDQVLAYLRDNALKLKDDVVGANMQYDLDWLAEDEVLFPNVRRFRDVQVAEPLIDELQFTYSLNAIAKRYDLEGKEEGLLREAAEAFNVDPKSGMWQLPAKYVGAYATVDVTLPLELLRLQEAKLAEEEVEEVWDMESRVLPALVAMRRRGVRIDFDHLSTVEAHCFAEEKKALDAIFWKINYRLASEDVWKSEALAGGLKLIGVKPPLTPKTQKPSVKADLLESIDHDVARLMLRARKFNKLRTTFVASIRRNAIGDRIHCTFNQLRKTDDDTGDEGGGRFGRLSSSDPNLQQQPSRDPEIGPFWRKVYVPDEGGEWCCLDFSQQEPRWTMHYAELVNCTKGHEAAAAYRDDPRTDNHNMMTQLVHGQAAWDGWDKATRKNHRDNCKQIFLGLCYGMGGAKLARKIGLPTQWKEIRGVMREVAGPEAQAVLDQFNARAPFLRQLSYKCQKRVEKVGFIRTAGQRKCRFPKKPNGDWDWTYKALNRLIQGSSADQTKLAMAQAHEEGIPMQLQVHDEIDLTIYDRSEADRLSEIMTHALPCNVPHVCDAEFGRSWGEIE